MQFLISNPMDFNVGLYIRLSKEDDTEIESQSVTNQRSLLAEFAKNHRLTIFDTYIDDGFSGTNFDRPAFNRMIADIEAKKVNMVVTKDMSRLGRDYIDTGFFMEKYFPEKHVRYISLLDGVDTGVNSIANDITPFRAIMNDMYAKDISKKISSVKHDKQNKGLFIGGKATYGYKKSETEKNKIVIDDEVAEVVRRIFAMALDGISCRQIAQTFNDEKLPPPAVYAGLTQGRIGPFSKMWSSERISDMLQNQSYIGNMVQGKTKKINYKSKKSEKMPRNEWIVVGGTHEPIIEKAVFDKVQLLLQSRRTTRVRTYDFLLKGLIFCHECGFPMAVINRPKANGNKQLFFICRTYQRFTKSGACTCHSIKELTVTEAVFEQIDAVCRNFIDSEALSAIASKELKSFKSRNCADEQIAKLEQKAQAVTNNLDKMYLDKLSGILSEEDFARVYTRMKADRQAIADKVKFLISQQNQNEVNKSDQVTALVERFLGTKNCNKELLISLVERVEYSENKEIFIYFKFPQLEHLKMSLY